MLIIQGFWQMTIIDEYRQRLNLALKDCDFELEDFSKSHSGHNHGCDGKISHLKVIVKNYENLKQKGYTRIDLHKKINAVFNNELKTNQIHALQIILI